MNAIEFAFGIANKEIGSIDTVKIIDNKFTFRVEHYMSSSSIRMSYTDRDTGNGTYECSVSVLKTQEKDNSLIYGIVDTATNEHTRFFVTMNFGSNGDERPDGEIVINLVADTPNRFRRELINTRTTNINSEEDMFMCSTVFDISLEIATKLNEIYEKIKAANYGENLRVTGYIDTVLDMYDTEIV